MNLGALGLRKCSLKIAEKHALNYRSHETLGLLEAAAENNIIALTFPPHSTHYLCPLDRACLDLFKKHIMVFVLNI